jgi:uncharacterized membrane-anchored protein
MMTKTAGALALAALLLGAAAAPAEDAPAPEEKIAWTPGPATVAIGERLAEVRLPETLAFAGAEDTRRLLERMGNRTDGSELGIVVPKAEDQSWFIVFEWNDVGYVKDDEKDAIDADALLASLRKGTEESNAWRKEHGLPALHVAGWAQPPRYDEGTHNLTWATLGRNEEGHESVNYNVRVLGREGVMSVTFVDDPKNLAAAKPAVDGVIGAFSYTKGRTYAEWVPGDKVAEYGLTALVAGGAGVAATKLGLFAALGKLFAKGGKLVVVGLAAIGAAAVKFWNALRGKAPARRAAGPGPGAGAA